MTSGIARRLGIAARTFVRDTPDEVAAAVMLAGYPLAHWDFAAIGLPTLAAALDEEVFVDVQRAFAEMRVGIPSISASYNVIHPDAGLRAKQTAEAIRLISLAPLLGGGVVTLCTGTRDPDNMWRAHPGNDRPEAWNDLRHTLDPLLAVAATSRVRLGIKPETGNVVHDAPTAARLLETLGDGAPIGVILDPADLVTPETVNRQDEVIRAAVDLLGDRIVGVKATDVLSSGDSTAGAGTRDYPAVLAQFSRLSQVPVIVQDVAESDAERVRAHLLRPPAS